MSTFYNSERLKYNQMNYNNDVELDNFCSQCLLVINAVGPSFKINDKIALHALRNNCHYIDIGGYGILRDLLKPYEKSIEAQKLCFIIGVGWMPGISGVFSKTIIETHLNSPENTNFNIYYGAVDNWSYSSTYDLAASSMGKTRSYVYSHGKEIQVSPFRYTHHKFFPFIGHKKICMPSFDEQLTQLATSLKQIRKISTFIMLNDYISMGKFMFIKIFYKHNLNKATLMLQDDYQRLVKKENKWGSVICQVSKIEPERKIDTFYYLYTKKEDMDGSRQMIFCNEYDRPASSFIDGEKDKNPNVALHTSVQTVANTSLFTITDIENAEVGKIVTIKCGSEDKGVKITKSDKFSLISADWIPKKGDTIRLMKRSDGKFIEIGRDTAASGALQFANDATTPSLAGATVFVTGTNTKATAITNFTDAVEGEVYTIHGAGNTNASTIANSGNFVLTDAMTLSAGKFIMLTYAGGKFYEVARG